MNKTYIRLGQKKKKSTHKYSTKVKGRNLSGGHWVAVIVVDSKDSNAERETRKTTNVRVGRLDYLSKRFPDFPKEKIA